MLVTPPIASGSIFGDDRRLSAHTAGIGTTLQRRSRLSGLSFHAALAAGVCLPDLLCQRLGDPSRSLALRSMRSGNFGAGRNDFPGQQTALGGLVSGDVAGRCPEEWRQHTGIATRVGLGQLPDRLDTVAQVAPGDDSARPRPTERRE